MKADPPALREHASGVLAGLAILLLASNATAAADLVITNARVFTGTGERPLERATVTVKGERIASVSSDSVDFVGAKVIDAAGQTVLPGLIDPHVHLFFDLQDGPSFPTSDAEAQSFIEEQLPADLEEYLQHGFTTIASVIDFWPHIVEARNRVASSASNAPRLLLAGGVFVAPGGHYVCRSQEGERRRWCDEHISVVAEEPEEAREGVKRYAESGVDLIVYDSLTNAPEFEETVAKAIVDEAHRHALPVLVHGSDAGRIGGLVAAGVEGFLHPPGGSSGESGLADAGERRIPIGITIGEAEHAIRENRYSSDDVTAYETVRRNVVTLLEAGAVPVFASDIPGASPDHTLPIVFRSLMDLGLSNAEALRAATHDAAAMLGKGDTLGTLEPGKLADIIIVDGNPFEDLAALENVRVVIQGGEIVVDRRRHP